MIEQLEKIVAFHRLKLSHRSVDSNKLPVNEENT